MKDLESTKRELLDLTQRVLDAISEADWETYQRLCDPTLTCFEPESHGHLVEGLDFHGFYFDLGPAEKPRNTTICSPHVRILGDTAVVCYVRLNQQVDPATGKPVTRGFSETRIWHRDDDGIWRQVHFHRSPCG